MPQLIGVHKVHGCDILTLDPITKCPWLVSGFIACMCDATMEAEQFCRPALPLRICGSSAY
eukprot:5888050-Pyramimonas_sp.AAC.2